MNHHDDPLDIALRSVESFGNAPEVLRELLDDAAAMLSRGRPTSRVSLLANNSETH